METNKNIHTIQKRPFHPEEPIITEEKLVSANNIFLAFFIGILTILIAAFAIAYFDPTMTQSFIIIIVAVLIYSVILLFLLEPRVLRKVQTKEIQYIERPVIKEVVRTVEKPVIKEIIKTVEKPVVRRIFVEKEKKKLNIPKYDYVGSTQTMTFHKRNCRLGKLIKRKYKISKNDKDYFKRNGFKTCKVCMKTKSKKK